MGIKRAEKRIQNVELSPYLYLEKAHERAEGTAERLTRLRHCKLPLEVDRVIMESSVESHEPVLTRDQ